MTAKEIVEKLYEILNAPPCKENESNVTLLQSEALIQAISIIHKVENNEFVKLPAPVADDYSGLKVKYRVFKAEYNSPVENCFVLRPEKDEAAKVALRAYAEVCGNEQLTHEIYMWL